MAKIGSSQPPPPPPGGRRIGSAGGGSAGPPAPAASPAESAGTLAQRLASATMDGGLPAVPAAYADGQDWETVLGDDVFARLYLAAPLHAQVTDAQVQANLVVLTAFWRGKLNRFVTGDRDVEDLYRPGTVSKAADLLAAAATALADAAGRATCFGQLERRRQEAAGKGLDDFLRPLLHLPVLNNKAFEQAAERGEAVGFTRPEAETHLLHSLRQAGYAPVKTLNQSPNLLLAEWTPGGAPLTNRPSTKVMGHDVYTLAEAGQVLYEAITSPSERDKAQRNLDSSEYLAGLAADLKERDAQQDINDLFRRVALPKEQRRLAALYLFGPGLPYYLGPGQPAFASPAELLTRTAHSAADFAAAEEAYAAGLLPIWIQAAGTASVKAALPATKGQPSALDLRRFLHAARPDFPLWLQGEALASPVALAAYIGRDERSWESVYGSLTGGSLGLWLAALGQRPVLERQAQLAEALLRGAPPTSEAGRRLIVQALLEALDPLAATPALAANPTRLDLSGLSGETQAERTLTLTNTTGGPVLVQLSLVPALEGVRLSATHLFFDQRAPGQQLRMTVTGNPTQMPRDGRHEAKLRVATAYGTADLPVVAEAVFPTKEFLQFVGGAALMLGLGLGAVRYALGLLLGEGAYQQMLARGGLLPLSSFEAAGRGPGGWFLLALALLLGVLFFFFRTLRKLAKPKPAA